MARRTQTFACNGFFSFFFSWFKFLFWYQEFLVLIEESRKEIMICTTQSMTKMNDMKKQENMEGMLTKTLANIFSVYVHVFD